MKHVRRFVIGGAIGVATVAGLTALHAPFLVGEAVILAPAVLLLALGLYCRRARRRAPDRFRAYVTEHFDAAAGPPAGAESVDEPVVARWCSHAEPGLLAADFRYVAPGRELSRRRYLRALRVATAWLPETARLEEAVADPAEPAVVWVRQSSVVRPSRGGPEIKTGAWHRWTLTPDRGRIRRFELVAFVEPLVHA
jgi:hypothetical protein